MSLSHYASVIFVFLTRAGNEWLISSDVVITQKTWIKWNFQGLARESENNNPGGNNSLYSIFTNVDTLFSCWHQYGECTEEGPVRKDCLFSGDIQS